MNTFKDGDKVYFPMQTTKVCTISKSSSLMFPLSINAMGEELGNCTILGKALTISNVPNIYHVTKENRELLEKLYGVEFETPPPKTVSVTLEIPEPFEPKLNERYWYLDNCGEVNTYIFHNDAIDNLILFKWRTEEEARQSQNTFNATFGTPL